MNQRIKSYYLTYNGHVATPNFPNGTDVYYKVAVLCDAFAALGINMELHADLIYSDEENEEQ